jgi:hypothetical protein
MVTFLLGFLCGLGLLLPVIGFIVWMWKTDTRLLTRLYENEWESSRRMARMWAQGTTTRATGSTTTTIIRSWDDGASDD